LLPPEQLWLGALREGEEVERVGAASRVDLALGRELLQSVLPHALQQAVADVFGAPTICLNQALIYERGHAVEHVLRGWPAPTAGGSYGLGPVHRETPSEDAQAPKKRQFGRIEQIVAPADGLSQRVLTLGEIPGFPSEQREALL
jgi:hypothetical protein